MNLDNISILIIFDIAQHYLHTYILNVYTEHVHTYLCSHFKHSIALMCIIMQDPAADFSVPWANLRCVDFAVLFCFHFCCVRYLLILIMYNNNADINVRRCILIPLCVGDIKALSCGI